MTQLDVGPGRPDVGPCRRLYGMMQHLLTVAAHHELPEVAPARGVVTRHDALDAVLQVAAVIDEAVQAGHIPVERGCTACRCSCLPVNTSSRCRGFLARTAWETK